MHLPTVIVAGLCLLSAPLRAQTNWASLSTPTTKHLWGITTVGDSTVVAVGFNGVVVRSTNAGLTWAVDSMLYNGRTVTLRFVEAADTTNLWAGYWGSPTFRSTDGGTTWFHALLDSDATIARVRFNSPQLGFAAGFEHSPPYRGRILRTTDGGSRWHLLLDTTGHAFHDVQFVDSTFGIAVGSFNPVFDNFDPESIFRTTDGGVTWTYVPAPGDGPLGSVVMWNHAAGFAAGDNIHLLSTSDSGKTWIPRSLGMGTNYPIHSVTMTSQSEAWAVVGALGSVYHTTDNGVTWTATPLPGASNVLGVHFASNGQGYAVGSLGGIWKYSPATGVVFDGSDHSIPSMSMESHPNPFNPKTTITFAVDSHCDVQLRVVDALGRLVAELLGGAVAPGTHKVAFDGSTLSSGVYYAILTVGPRRAITKLVLLR